MKNPKTHGSNQRNSLPTRLNSKLHQENQTRRRVGLYGEQALRPQCGTSLNHLLIIVTNDPRPTHYKVTNPVRPCAIAKLNKVKRISVRKGPLFRAFQATGDMWMRFLLPLRKQMPNSESRQMQRKMFINRLDKPASNLCNPGRFYRFSRWRGNPSWNRLFRTVAGKRPVRRATSRSGIRPSNRSSDGCHHFGVLINALSLRQGGGYGRSIWCDSTFERLQHRASYPGEHLPSQSKRVGSPALGNSQGMAF